MITQDTRNSSTWYALREFETRDITTRSYWNRHTKTLSAGKSQEISSNFIQAREYFRNASEADITVRPLLQYYGVASLSRGLALFLDQTMREATLSQSHGLQVRNWGQTLSTGLAGIGNLGIGISKGIFHDLLLATGNKFYFRHNSSGVNWSIGAGIPPVGAEISVIDAVERIPEVSDQYYAWLGEGVAFMVMKSLTIDREKGIVTYTVASNQLDKLNEIFPLEMFPDRIDSLSGNELNIICPEATTPFFAQGVGSFGIGSVVLCKPLNGGLYFTPLAICFVVSFVLGMLCRYFPTTWINLGRTGKGDGFYPLAIRLLDWIRDAFPAMVVDILKGPYQFEKK